MRFAGSGLSVRFKRALAHLEVESAREPDCTFFVGDDATTGVRLPVDRFASPGTYVVTSSDDPTRTAVAAYDAERGIFNALDRDGGIGVFWCSDAMRLPQWEDGAPLRILLHWWTANDQRHQVHGGAVGRSGGGVLVVGPGGSGKSTTALACALGGLEYAGDDYTVVCMKEGPTAHSLYNSAKLEWKHAGRFPSLMGSISNQAGRGDEKALIFMNEVMPDRVVPRLDIAAVLVPEVGTIDVASASAISRAEALRALALSTIAQLPGGADQALSVMRALIAAVPCYRLTLGRDIGSVVGVVDDVLGSSG